MWKKWKNFKLVISILLYKNKIDIENRDNPENHKSYKNVLKFKLCMAFLKLGLFTFIKKNSFNKY